MKSKTEMLALNKKIKVGRNDACPCGSGLKYKKCCLGKTEQSLIDIKNSYKEKHKILLKDPADVKGIRAAGQLVIDTLDLVESEIRPGMLTDEINTWVHEFTVQRCS